MRRHHVSVMAALAVAVTAVATAGAGLYTATTGLASTVTFSKTLAGPSTAPMYPSGLIWDPGPCTTLLPPGSSCIVVADTGYNRVSIFSPSSAIPPSATATTPVLSFGSLGTGTGQFNTPRDVAVDPLGNIYVADAANSRIEAFDKNGTFLWEAGSRIPGTACTAKLTVPCLSDPLGISFDASTNQVLVADTGHSVIKAYSTTGTWLWTSPTGIMSSPREARRGPDGEIWVADYHNQEIKAFLVTSAGVWTTNAGGTVTPNIVLGDGLAAGHGNGEINSPYNVAFSPSGTYAYVSDTGNERIAVWNISMTPLHPPVWIENIGSRCPSSCPPPPGNVAYFNAIRRVTVDTAGNIWAADFWGSGLHEFAALPPGITSPASSPAAAIGEIDGSPAPPPGFAEAYGVTVALNGTTYVVDRLNQRIEQFTAAGTYVNDTGSRGTAIGKFSWPETAAVAPDGTVWVGDTRNDRLQHYTATLTKRPTAVGSSGSGVGQFNYIEGITVAANGMVWIADTKNNRIQSYNPTTNVFTAYGTKGTGQGQFSLPEGLAVSATDVYVADTNNNRIEELDLNGTYVGQYTGLDQPQGIALAADGSLWVADTGTSQTDTNGNQIVQLSSELTEVSSFGGPGTGPTQFDLPHSLAVFGSTLFVADTYNNRVQEFTLS